MVKHNRYWVFYTLITMTTISPITTSKMMVNKPYYKSANKKRPNLLIFLVDDMGYGDVGVYNNRNNNNNNNDNNNDNNNNNNKSYTPNIDLFSKEGMMFTDYHSPYSVCTPSRAAMLTGRLGGRTGVYK